MDTHNASPKFNIGDRVRFLDETGTVIGASSIAPLIRLDNGELHQVAWYALERIPPLGVAAWRLLFRAHRDGLEMIRKPVKTEYYVERMWHHNASDTTLILEERGDQ